MMHIARGREEVSAADGHTYERMACVVNIVVVIVVIAVGLSLVAFLPWLFNWD
jgi:hypothetical protein